MPLNDFIIIDDALLESYIDQLIATLSHDELHYDPEGHTPRADIIASIKGMIKEARGRRPETMSELTMKLNKLTAEIRPLRMNFINAKRAYKIIRDYALKSILELDDAQVGSVNALLIGLSRSHAQLNGLEEAECLYCDGENDDDY